MPLNSQSLGHPYLWCNKIENTFSTSLLYSSKIFYFQLPFLFHHFISIAEWNYRFWKVFWFFGMGLCRKFVENEENFWEESFESFVSWKSWNWLKIWGTEANTVILKISRRQWSWNSREQCLNFRFLKKQREIF